MASSSNPATTVPSSINLAITAPTSNSTPSYLSGQDADTWDDFDEVVNNQPFNLPLIDSSQLNRIRNILTDPKDFELWLQRTEQTLASLYLYRLQSRPKCYKMVLHIPARQNWIADNISIELQR